MDSASHQNYTRRWANELNVPVFSIDYRLAPKYPYPNFIDDCYQAYVWIVTQAGPQLGMDIDKIVFCGDSAGGHLTLSITMLSILRGFRQPDALVSIYPVLTLDMKHFFPSTMMMSDDELISFGFVSFCSACVVRRGGNPEQNPIMSPILANDALLQALPPV